MKPHYPLVISTLLMRLGVSIIVTHIVTSIWYDSTLSDGLVAVISIVSVGLGGLFSMAHLGRPTRFMNSFANLSSMLTWEAILTPLWLVSACALAVASYMDGPSFVLVLSKCGTVVFGISLIYATAKAYHLKARPSWATPLVLYEFFLSAACMGILAYLGLATLLGTLPSEELLPLGMVLLAVLLSEFALTISYRYHIRAVSKSASEVLQDRMSSLQYGLWIVLGLMLPAIVIAFALVTRHLSMEGALISFAGFFIGAVLWRVLFFRVATPIKITPDIV